MNVDVQQPSPRPRLPPQRDPASGNFPRSGRSGFAQSAPRTSSSTSPNQWLVDLTALSRCRALFARHTFSSAAPDERPSNLAMLEVPPAFDAFCRSHFASVKRLHPALEWDDACPAYAIALSAHAVLCVALDDEREKQFEQNWERIRGQSRLTWPQARPLIVDGCSALGRMDPLAMQR